MPYADIEKQKECNRKKSARWRERNPNKVKKSSTAWKQNNKEKIREYNRRKNIEYHRGIALETYGTILSEQGGKCAICETTVPRGRGMFHVDHCHTTGIIRGLLCNDCNLGIGKLGDNASAVLRAYIYLANFEASNDNIPPTEEP